MLKNNFWNSAIIFGLGFLLIRAISFLLLPIYTNALNPNELGFVFIFITFLAFMNSIYSFGMDSALLKYYHNEKNVFFTSLISIFIFAIPCNILIYVSSDWIELILFSNISIIENKIIIQKFWVFLAIIILTLDAISARIMTLIRILNLSYYYLIIAGLNIIVSLSLNLYFLYFINSPFKFDGVVYSLAIVSIVQCIGLMPIALYKINNWSFNTRLFKKMFYFAWPFFPATIFFIIIELCDRIMIEHFLSAHDVGLYGAGYKIGALMLMIVRGFNLSWQPYYLKIGEKLNDTTIKKFSSIGNVLLLILIFIGGIISSLWPYLITVKIGSFSIIGIDFVPGGQIIPYILISYIFYGLFILQMPSIYLKNKQNWAPLLWGAGAMINIMGNIILLPKMGYMGAAISTLLSYSIMSIILIYKNYSWLWIPYNFKLLCFAILISISRYYIINNWEYNFIIIISIYGIIMAALLYKSKNKLL